MAALARGLNVLVLLGITGLLLIAFWYQLARDELPCPLCLLQRLGLVAAGLGLLLNVRYGASESHYGIAIVSALAGAAAAGREILLHNTASRDAFDGSLFGLHFYTVAFIVFCLIILFCGAMLFIEGQFVEGVRDVRPSLLAQALGWVFVLVALGNAASTLLLCGVGPCPENPTGYELPWR